MLPLILFWTILSGHYSLFFLCLALISAFSIQVLVKKLFSFDYIAISLKLKWLVFIYQIFKEMLISSLFMIKTICSKNIVVKQYYGLVKFHSSDKNKQVVYANSITLTPGTMTLAINDNEIMVHSLDSQFIEDLRTGNLEKYTLQLEKQ